MNTICIHCHQPFEWSGQGQQPKFCSTAHKSAHHRQSKATLQAIKSPKPTQTPPPEPTQIPDPDHLIGADGINYTDPYKVLPPHIAVYMPCQSTPGQRKSDLLSLEHRIHKATPKDAHCKF
jgi:hypothetical protein